MNGRTTALSRWTRVALVVALAALPVGGIAVLPPTDANAQAGNEYDVEKTLTDGNGDTYETRVTVKRRTRLFDRAQVQVTLSGFQPTFNANNVAGAGAEMENPVVVMQCRGADPRPETCLNRQRSVYYAGYDAEAPDDEPEENGGGLTGFKSRAHLLTQRGGSGQWLNHPGETVEERKTEWLTVEQLPFVHADRTAFLWDPQFSVRPDGTPLINEPARKSFAPPDTAVSGSAVIATRSIPIPDDPETNNTNSFLFEVRARASQPSLGCSDTVPCSIVVVPILRMNCPEGAPAACTSGHNPGTKPPGEPGTGEPANRFLTARAWFAETNWDQRWVVPITFDPDPETCAIQDPRPQVPLLGSELIDVAQQRWALAYCQGARTASYLPVYTQRAEYEARRQFTGRIGEEFLQDAVFTSQPVTDSPRPVAHAPSAITGFAVAFAVDGADGQQINDITLSPRLLAKLLTQSYSAETGPRLADDVRSTRQLYEAGDPVTSDTEADGYYIEFEPVAANPYSMFADPEFVDLNPLLPVKENPGDTLPAGHLRHLKNPVIFQVESDIILDLTRYLSSDPATRAWLDGTPDQHGMKVNPAWRGMQPFELYSLLDQWVRPPSPRRPTWVESNPSDRFFIRGGGDSCDELYRTPALTRLANVASSAELAATALLDRRGSATPLCPVTVVPEPSNRPGERPDWDVPGVDYLVNEGKSEPSEFGLRSQLAITTVAHARLYELPTARLLNADKRPVPPADDTMRAAVLSAGVQDPATGTVRIDHSRVTGDAYPGAMVVYTAAPTAGLDRETAGRYADFIQFMATEGQTPGAGLTNLPPGYDPLPASMRQQAIAAAAAVRDQTGEVPQSPPLEEEPATAAADPPPATEADNPGNGVLPAAAAPPAGAGPATEDGNPRQAAGRTAGASSWWAQWALLVLLAAGGAIALAAASVRIATDPDHPVRRALTGLVRR